MAGQNEVPGGTTQASGGIGAIGGTGAIRQTGAAEGTDAIGRTEGKLRNGTTYGTEAMAEHGTWQHAGQEDQLQGQGATGGTEATGETGANRGTGAPGGPGAVGGAGAIHWQESKMAGQRQQAAWEQLARQFQKTESRADIECSWTNHTGGRGASGET